MAELKVASGEAPRVPGRSYVALPEDIPDRAKEWAEDEVERQKWRGVIIGKLQAAETNSRAAL